MKKILLLASLLLSSVSLFAQQGQTSDVSHTEKPYSVNSVWVQGLAPGYWPTCTNQGAVATCSGLALYVAKGTVWCQGTLRTYAGGTLAMTNNTTNYVYLDPSANCAPAASTSSFSATQVPIATVVTSSGVITTITDERSWIIDLSSAQLSDGASLATKAGVQDESYTCANDTGSTNAYAISISPAPSVVTYSEFCFKATNANTGASTLAVDGAGAVSIKRKDGTPVQSGDIPAGGIVSVKYDGTNYQCGACGAGSGGSGSAGPGFSHQQCTNSSTGAITTLNCTGLLNVAVGDFVVGFCAEFFNDGGTRTFSFTDTQGNTWTQGATYYSSTVGGRQSFFWSSITTGGADGFNCIASASGGSFAAMAVYNIVGANTSSPVDASATNQGATTANFWSGTLTTSKDNDLNFLWVYRGGTSGSDATQGGFMLDNQTALGSSLAMEQLGKAGSYSLLVFAPAGTSVSFQTLSVALKP